MSDFPISDLPEFALTPGEEQGRIAELRALQLANDAVEVRITQSAAQE